MADMTLLDEIKAKCSVEMLASRDSDAIAALVSVGRTSIVPRLGGIGAVMETLGAVDGPVVLDALDSLKATLPAVKWGWVLLERGELDFGSVVTRQLIDGLVMGGVMTDAQGLAIKSLAEQPDPVSEFDVRRAIWADDGEYLA